MRITIRTKTRKGPGRVVYNRNHKNFSKDKFMRDLKLIPFWLVELSVIFYHLFNDIVDTHAPLKKFRIKTKPAPWQTERFFYLAWPRGPGHHNSVSHLLWARITYLSHPVNFPCQRKPEYPEKSHDFRQSVLVQDLSRTLYAFHLPQIISTVLG